MDQNVNENTEQEVKQEVKQNIMQDERTEFRPILTMKRPNELTKVRILEETAQKGTPEDLTAVLETYGSFELTARALGIAARYRGPEFVDVLEKHGATFRNSKYYYDDPAIIRKYRTSRSTGGGCYQTEYYLMTVSGTEKFPLDTAYTPWYGLSDLNKTLSPKLRLLSLEKRLEAAKLFAERKNLGVSMEEMLYWALLLGETEFADGLIKMGVNFREGRPAYYRSKYGDPAPTYLELITVPQNTVYWNLHIEFLSALKEEKVLPVLERFQMLAGNEGKKIAVTQKIFDTVSWNDRSFDFIVRNADISRIGKKQSLEAAVSTNSATALRAMAEAGWLADRNRREELITFAQKNQHTEALAWLIDFKNRTVDLAAEEAKEEEKLFRELMENPDSVSALSKKWSYKKSEDGTLRITSYKGTDTEVEIPAKIGRANVTAVADKAFANYRWYRDSGSYRSRLSDNRSRITSVTVPEGVAELGSEVFYDCGALETVILPSTLQSIGPRCFSGCKSLKNINIPENVKEIGRDIFQECGALYDQDGFLILSGRLFIYKDDRRQNRTAEKVYIPADVKIIAKYAFYGSNAETVVIPEGVKQIDGNAFSYCDHLRNIYIPATVVNFGKEILGSGYGCGGHYNRWSAYINIHTPAGSAAEAALKEQYKKARIVNDYSPAT